MTLWNMMTDWFQIKRIRNRKFKITRILAHRMAQPPSNYSTVEAISICLKFSRAVAREIKSHRRTLTSSRRPKNKMTNWLQDQMWMAKKLSTRGHLQKPSIKRNTIAWRARPIRTWRLTNSWLRHRYTKDTRADNLKCNHHRTTKITWYPSRLAEVPITALAEN